MTIIKTLAGLNIDKVVLGFLANNWITMLLIVLCIMAHSYVLWIRNKKDNDYTNDDYLIILANDFKKLFNLIKMKGLKK